MKDPNKELSWQEEVEGFFMLFGFICFWLFALGPLALARYIQDLATGRY